MNSQLMPDTRLACNKYMVLILPLNYLTLLFPVWFFKIYSWISSLFLVFLVVDDILYEPAPVAVECGGQARAQPPAGVQAGLVPGRLELPGFVPQAQGEGAGAGASATNFILEEVRVRFLLFFAKCWGSVDRIEGASLERHVCRWQTYTDPSYLGQIYIHG